MQQFPVGDSSLCSNTAKLNTCKRNICHNYQHICIDGVYTAIKRFFETVPLDQYGLRQSESDQDLKHGTIILPLITQNLQLSSSRVHWHAFETLLDELAPLLDNNSLFLLGFRGGIYVTRCAKAKEFIKRRLETQNPGSSIRPRADHNIFDCVRIYVNTATERGELKPLQRSQLAMITFLGDFKGGELKLHWAGRWSMWKKIFIVAGEPKPTIVLAVEDTEITNMDFGGEKFQLEFFLPNLR